MADGEASIVAMLGVVRTADESQLATGMRVAVRWARVRVRSRVHARVNITITMPVATSSARGSARWAAAAGGWLR